MNSLILFREMIAVDFVNNTKTHQVNSVGKMQNYWILKLEVCTVTKMFWSLNKTELNFSGAVYNFHKAVLSLCVVCSCQYFQGALTEFLRMSVY